MSEATETTIADLKKEIVTLMHRADLKIQQLAKIEGSYLGKGAATALFDPALDEDDQTITEHDAMSGRTGECPVDSVFVDRLFNPAEVYKDLALENFVEAYNDCIADHISSQEIK